jgi:uncharacterized protein DUF3667
MKARKSGILPLARDSEAEMAVTEPALAAAEHALVVCPNCNTEFLGDYCQNCGEKQHHAEELTFRHFVMHATHELSHVDTKVFATLRYLFTRPGFLTQEFIAGRRLRYMRPFSLFMIAVAVFFLADAIKPVSSYNLHRLMAQDKKGQIGPAFEKLAKARNVTKEVIVESVQDTLHRASTAAQILNALAMAVVLAMFFHKRYFVEHLVFSLHFLSITFFGALIFALLKPPRLAGLYFFLFSSAVFVTYLFLAMRRVYGQGRVATFFKAVAAYAVTQLLIGLTFILVLVAAVVRAALIK